MSPRTLLGFVCLAWSAACAGSDDPSGDAVGKTTASMTTRIEEKNGAITYTPAPCCGAWHPGSNAAHSGGSHATHMDVGAAATLTFTGTGVTWLGLRDPWSGIARVYVDGSLMGTVDTYSASTKFQSPLYSISGLAPAAHTLMIDVAYQRNPAAQGYWVSVDAFDVTSGATGCSLNASAATVQVGQSYSLALSTSSPAASASWYGTSNGNPEGPVAVGEFPSGGTSANVTYTAQAGWEGAYTRYVVFRDSAGNPLCTTNTVSVSIVSGGGGVPTTAPNPLLLPAATTSQFPATAAYDAINVPSLPAGASYLDPTTGVKIHKITSGSFPTSGPSFGHSYSEGNDEVSLPHTGSTRTVHVYTGFAHWLVDFTPGAGVSNARQLTGPTAVWSDIGITFSNNPATPYFAYISTNGGSAIRRFDVRTMTEAPGDGWPVTGETEVVWLHQSENDGLFTWMRTYNGPTIVGYEPSTGTKKTYTNNGLNEPRIDRGGRYVSLSMTTPANGLVIWDFQTDSVVWTGSGTVPFAHQASLKRRWYGVNWDISFPGQFWSCRPDAPNSCELIGGPANGSLVYGNGNWIQSPADLNDQWALFSNYAKLYEGGSSWLAPGGLILITANGERRLMGHPYNTSTDYNLYSFAKMSSDGRFALFTSNMNGSARSDLFLAELP